MDSKKGETSMTMDGMKSPTNYRIISFQPLVEESLKINLPGFKREDLYVRLLPQGILQIGGKRSLDDEGLVKSFQFEFGFPKSGKISDIKASFINEVLQITFPAQLATEAVTQTQQQKPLSSTLPLKDSIALSRAKSMVINEDPTIVERKDDRSSGLIIIEGDESSEDAAKKYNLSMRSEVMKEKLKEYMENLMSLMGFSSTELLEMGKSKVGRVTVTMILIVLGAYAVHLLTSFSKKYRHN